MTVHRVLQRLRRRVVRLTLYLTGLLLAVLTTIVVGFAVQARIRLPDLQPWHRLRLADDYRVDAPNAPQRFEDYLTLEARLFAALQRLDLAAGGASVAPTSRYEPSSVPGRLAMAPGGNRTHELTPANPNGAVLLVHGLSDSPYSMHRLAEWYFARGFYVLSLRLPGHGTLPSGLLDVRWQDWYGAVALAARHAASRRNGGPLHFCGYSTGAPLLTLLAARALSDASLPRPDRLVMLSAAIGVSRFAALANIASTLSFVPYFEKAEWLDVLPEYDPYKYNSFPVNAGNQIYRLTMALRAELDAAADRLGEMPKVLAFQSVVDATVSAADLVTEFLLRLPDRGHELVAFDRNRSEGWATLLPQDQVQALERVRAAPTLPFTLTLVGNADPGTRQVAAFVRAAGTRDTVTEPLDLAWPPLVFSLGHVALPFAIDDPIYGLQPEQTGPLHWPLGADVARGEAGANLLPFASLARLRCNPFFAVIERRLAAALEQDRR